MINYTNRLDGALRIAARVHEKQGQHRKGTDIPYIIHPFGVMAIASNVTDDEDTLIACLLHDVLEDVDPVIYNTEQMARDFGNEVVSIVKDVTYDAEISNWQAKCKAYLEHLDNVASEKAVIVSIADKIHNLISTLSDYERQGDLLWQIFTTKSASDQLWWYKEILTVTTKRKAPVQLTRQLSELVKKMDASIKNP